ncbi:hypothetical protein GCM10027347_60110 [Larkinella harenae]
MVTDKVTGVPAQVTVWLGMAVTEREQQLVTLTETAVVLVAEQPLASLTETVYAPLLDKDALETVSGEVVVVVEKFGPVHV